MNKPDIHTLLRLKTEHGQIHILQLEEQAIYYRSLSTLEHLSFLELYDKMPKEDWDSAVCQIAVLYPDTLDFKLGGTTASLAAAIMRRSAVPEEDFQGRVDIARKWARGDVSSLVPYGLAVMTSALYPGIDLVSLLRMPVDELFRMVAILELATQRSIFTPDTPLPADAGPLKISQQELEHVGVSVSQINQATTELSRDLANHHRETR